MKTILIEQVANGWIVRGHYDDPKSCQAEAPRVYAYTSMAELQKDLPMLLGDEPPKPDQTARAMSASEMEALHRSIGNRPGLGVGTAAHNPDGSLIF